MEVRVRSKCGPKRVSPKNGLPNMERLTCERQTSELKVTMEAYLSKDASHDRLSD